MMLRLPALVIAAAVVLPHASGFANPVKSLYTTVDLSACKKVRQHRPAWRCSGLAGNPVYIAGRRGQFVSVGTHADKRRAASQTPGTGDALLARGDGRAIVEWRFDRRGDKRLPYAIIVRFHAMGPAPKGDILVVLKVDAHETCHVAYIGAQANDNAIVQARAIADVQARTFDCRREPIAEAAAGAGPM
jgi:hypothetical protein